VETVAGIAALPVEVCTTGTTTVGAYGFAVAVGVVICNIQLYIFIKVFKTCASLIYIVQLHKSRSTLK
jgi:hypothetical protein